MRKYFKMGIERKGCLSRLSPPTPTSYKKPAFIVPALRHLVFITTSTHPHNHITWYRIPNAPAFDTIPFGLGYQPSQYRMTLPHYCLTLRCQPYHLVLITTSDGLGYQTARLRIQSAVVLMTSKPGIAYYAGLGAYIPATPSMTYPHI